MCQDCERKDRVIDGLKESVIIKTKQARLNTVTELYHDIRYPTTEQKQAIIESLVRSNLEIDFIKDLANKIERAQGTHNGHYR